MGRMVKDYEAETLHLRHALQSPHRATRLRAQKAFLKLHEGFVTQTYQRLRKALRPGYDEEDLLQEIYWVLFKSLDKWDPAIARFSTLVLNQLQSIIGIACRKRKDAMESGNYPYSMIENDIYDPQDQEDSTSYSYVPSHVPSVPSNIPETEQEIYFQELKHCIHKFHKNPNIKIIEQLYFEDKSAKELAQERGCSVQGINYKKQQGLCDLRKVLNAQLYDS